MRQASGNSAGRTLQVRNAARPITLSRAAHALWKLLYAPHAYQRHMYARFFEVPKARPAITSGMCMAKALFGWFADALANTLPELLGVHPDK